MESYFLLKGETGIEYFFKVETYFRKKEQ